MWSGVVNLKCGHGVKGAVLTEYDREPRKENILSAGGAEEMVTRLETRCFWDRIPTRGSDFSQNRPTRLSG